MRILFACIPATGHSTPTFAAANVLKDAGHTVAIFTGTIFKHTIESAGLKFFALPKDVDVDLRDVDTALPERKYFESGVDKLFFDMKAVHIDPMLSQASGLRDALRHFPADIIIHETGFCGVLPMLLGPRHARPASACLGVTTLRLPRADGAPIGPGLPPATTNTQRAEYRRMAHAIDTQLTDPVRAYADNLLRPLGLPALSGPLFESTSVLADAILQCGVPDTEFPLQIRYPNLHFIGYLPSKNLGDEPPELRNAISAGKSVVVVSQGTVANNDLGQLLCPAMRAFSKRHDILVLATTGGQSIEKIPCARGANVIAREFIDFSTVLPRADLLIAFGGFGTVTQALALGVPMVLAGLTEDKPEIAARVEWAGSGIYLRTNDPTDADLAQAAHEILTNPRYQKRAQEISSAFAVRDAAHELTALVAELAAR